MTSDANTLSSDGEELQVRAPGGGLYASVFLSKNRRRLGIRLEQCRSFGKGFVVWIDPRAMPQIMEACGVLLKKLEACK